MKKTLCSLFFIFLLFNFISINAFSIGQNLIKNPSFEEISDGKPTHWDSWFYDQSNGAVELKVEQETGRTGKSSALIINNNATDARFKQNIMVNENSKYKFSGWIKTQSVGTQKLGANISIENHLGTSIDINGTENNWQSVELYITTGSGVNNFTVTIGLGGYANDNKGKAWFDDLYLEEVDLIPDGSRVIDIAFSQPEDSKKDSEGENTKSPGESQGRYTWILLVFAIIISSGALYYNYFWSNTKKKDNSET